MIYRYTLIILFLSIFASSSHSQWESIGGVGISGSTKWEAVSMDGSGNFYFSGFTDKLAGSPSRAFVTAKYSHGLTPSWSTKLLTASSSYGEISNGVDAAGNSYMISTFLNAPITLPDGSQISYFLKAFFVAKFDPTGKLAWAKKLVIPEYSRFQVMPDGTIGILAKDIVRFYLFGSDSVRVDGNYLIEISTDGTLSRSVSLDEPNLVPTYLEWLAPGKVFLVNTTEFIPGSITYQRAIFDLDSHTVTPEGTPLAVSSAPNTFDWNHTGLPNAATTVREPKSGHLFALMSAYTSKAILNETDTIYPKTNSQILDAYVVELDTNMRVVRRQHLTNPVALAVRDSLVVVTAIVRGSGDYGFTTPDTTIKITRKQYQQDGYVLYVMDRDFHYKRHGLVESEYQKFLNHNATFITPSGEIYTSLEAAGTLFFQGQPAFSGHSGTVFAKLGGALASVTAERTLNSLTVFPNPATTTVTLAQSGSFHYTLTNLLGQVMCSGDGQDKVICSIPAALSNGAYYLTTEVAGALQCRRISVVKP